MTGVGTTAVTSGTASVGTFSLTGIANAPPSSSLTSSPSDDYTSDPNPIKIIVTITDPTTMQSVGVDLGGDLGGFVNHVVTTSPPVDAYENNVFYTPNNSSPIPVSLEGISFTVQEIGWANNPVVALPNGTGGTPAVFEVKFSGLPASVPEPSSVVLMALGWAGTLTLFLRRRRSKSEAYAPVR
jgi:hypothetical protein